MTIATTHPTSENAIDETNLYQAYHHDLVQNQSSLLKEERVVAIPLIELERKEIRRGGGIIHLQVEVIP